MGPDIKLTQDPVGYGEPGPEPGTFVPQVTPA